MDKAKKADNHAKERDYPQEAGMETRVNEGEQTPAGRGVSPAFSPQKTFQSVTENST